MRSRCRLTGAVISEICEHMAECASHIPKEFQRRCRTLFESTCWKATECRQFLLYSGPVVLSNTGVPRKQYENFLYLSAAIRCLCSKTLFQSVHHTVEFIMALWENAKLFGIQSAAAQRLVVP